MEWLYPNQLPMVTNTYLWWMESKYK